MPQTFHEWMMLIFMLFVMLWALACLTGVIVAIGCGIKYIMGTLLLV